MKPGGVSVTAVLDEAAELVPRELASWAGLLALTSLPLRFLEAHFLNRLFQLGDNATDYVNYLLSLSWLVAFALLPALWGRAVFARACALALSGRAAGRGAPLRALRPSFPSFAAYAYAATVAELLLVLFGWTVVALPLLALYAGLAAATSYLQERPGPLASLALPMRTLRPFFPFLGLTAIFAVALLLALINLFFLFALGLWLAGGASGLDLSWWQVTLTPDNQQYLLLLIACAVTVVEPFWIASLVAAVRRVRARESGEDLSAWFADIQHREQEDTDEHGPSRTSKDSAPPVSGVRARPSQSVFVRVLLPAALLLLPAALAAETISPATYRDRLAGIQERLRANDWVGARTDARGLLEDQIAFGIASGQERVEPDRSVLGPIANAANPEAARASAPALSQLVNALSTRGSEGRAPAPDPKLLEEVRAREALAALPQGGRLPEVQDGGLFAALAGFLEPIAEAISDFFEKIWDWLLDLLFSGRSAGGSAVGLNLVVVTVLVVVLALVLGWVGWRVLRKRRRGAAPAVAGPAPLPPSADDDPLSREANEWERYARELAAAGRAREAIRAWYHAVLVAFYRAGTLHYRRGRTNWEYVSAVPPGTAWRSRFVEMTRHFEREWYGRDRSTPEALRESEEMALSLLSAVRERAA